MLHSEKLVVVAAGQSQQAVAVVAADQSLQAVAAAVLRQPAVGGEVVPCRQAVVEAAALGSHSAPLSFRRW